MSPEVKAVIDAARTAWSEYELTHRPRTHPPTEWHPFETVSPDAGSIETTTMLAIRNALAALDAAPAGTPDPLADLVTRFSAALLEKLRAAEKKYGYQNGWMGDAWDDVLRTAIREHIEKGDPRDVAAYCAFAWHHGWSLAAPSIEADAAAGRTPPSPEDYVRAGIEAAAKRAEPFRTDSPPGTISLWGEALASAIRELDPAAIARAAEQAEGSRDTGCAKGEPDVS